MTRDKHIAPIAAFINKRDAVLARGEREGVEWGDVYILRRDNTIGEAVVHLRIYDVYEKFSIARTTWVHDDCPPLELGWNAYLYVGERIRE